MLEAAESFIPKFAWPSLDNIKHQNSSALHWAIKTDNLRFAKILLSYHADLNALVDGYSPLMMAVICESQLTFNLILKKRNMLVNLRNLDGKSALWYSVEKESYAMVRQLLRHRDIHVDLLHVKGRTALWLAVFQGNKDIISLLVLKGANRDMRDEDGISPWSEACIKKSEFIKYLLLEYWKYG